MPSSRAKSLRPLLLLWTLITVSCDYDEGPTIKSESQDTNTICLGHDNRSFLFTESSRLQSELDACLSIRLYVYRVIQDGRKQTQTKVDQVLNTLYNDFEPLNIHFELLGQSDIQDDPTGDWWLANTTFIGPKYLLFSSSTPYQPNAINIYLLPDDYRAPDETPFNSNGEGRVVKNGPFEKVGLYVGGRTNIAGIGPDQGSNMDNHMISHEMGHCLGLTHSDRETIHDIMDVGPRTQQTKFTGPFEVGGIIQVTANQFAIMTYLLENDLLVSNTVDQILKDPALDDWLMFPNQGPNNNLWPFVTGDVINIAWDQTQVSSGSQIRIDLVKGDAHEKTLVESTNNDGLWSWTVPSSLGLPNGGGIRTFRIEITDVDSPCTNYDVSNQAFSLMISN